MNVLSLWSRAPVYTPKASWFRSEQRHHLPTLRLRAGGGQLVCLLRAQSSTTDPNGARVLAFIASWRAPFLRRFRLYHQGPPILSPGSTPSAA